MGKRSGWGLLLLTGAMALLCFSLALWQWQRGEQKQLLLVELDQQLAQPPQLINQLGASRLQRYQPVLAAVQADNRHQLLWDNQIFNGQVGYRVLTPVQDRRGRWWLVDRGWLPAPPLRTQLPVVPDLPADLLRGWIWPLQPRALELDSPEPESGWPRRIQQPQRARLEQALGVSLMPWLLRLAPDSPGALQQEAPSPIVMGPERHRGYALQWILLALFLAVMTVWLGWKGSSGRGE